MATAMDAVTALHKSVIASSAYVLRSTLLISTADGRAVSIRGSAIASFIQSVCGQGYIATRLRRFKCRDSQVQGT